MLERKRFPFGFAPPAGHVDNKGCFESAAKEEVKEEVGLKPLSVKLIKEREKNNKCRRENGNWHYWKIYQVKAEGIIKRSKNETKQAGWFSVDQIKLLSLKTEKYLNSEITQEEWKQSPGIEAVWYEWFKVLKITK